MITPQYLLENIKKYPNENALSTKDSSGNWNRQSWKDFYKLTELISKSFHYLKNKVYYIVICNLYVKFN